MREAEAQASKGNEFHFGPGEPSTKNRLVRKPNGEFEINESDVEEDDYHRDPQKEYMVINDRMQEFIIVDSGSRFKASDLGLELDHTASHMNITQTRLRISQMEGQRVDVVDSKGRVTAIWKVVKEAKEDEELIRQRQLHFLDHGMCDVDFNSPNFSLCDLFFQLWPGDREEQLRRLNVEICQANKNAARRAFGHRGISDCTMDEYLTFIAILIGATCYYKGGDALWSTKSKGIVAPPEFGRYMTHRRFKELRRYVSHVMSWPELKQDYAWWRIGSFVQDFNAN